VSLASVFIYGTGATWC